MVSEFMGYGRETIAIIMGSCSKASLTSHEFMVFNMIFLILIFCYVWQKFIGSEILFLNFVFFLSSE